MDSLLPNTALSAKERILSEDSDMASLDNYQEKLHSFELPDTFEQNLKARIQSGTDFSPAFGQLFFETLELSGLLGSFNNQYDPDIRELIRENLDAIILKYFKGSSLVITPSFIKKCIKDWKEFTLPGFRSLLKSCYKRNLDRKALDDVSSERDRVKGDVRKTLQIAYSDQLTTIPNRRAYDDHIKYLFENKPGKQMAFLRFDLDHFKQINDTLGHSNGDLVLKRFAKLLSTHARDGQAFRVGGEEFDVTLELGDDWTREQVIEMSNQVRKEFSEIDFSVEMGQENSVHATCSCGVAFGLTDDLGNLGDGGKISRVADKLLYKSKNEGRNRTSVADLHEADAVA